MMIIIVIIIINYMRFHVDHTAESPLCRMCRSKGETVAHVVSECGNLAQTENIKEGTTTWRGLFTGNFVVNVDWKELIAGMNRSLREWWKVKTSRYCGIPSAYHFVNVLCKVCGPRTMQGLWSPGVEKLTFENLKMPNFPWVAPLPTHPRANH